MEGEREAGLVGVGQGRFGFLGSGAQSQGQEGGISREKRSWGDGSRAADGESWWGWE